MASKIGQVAKQCDVSRDTIRHYEKLGLLKTVPRTASGYRIYGDDTVERVRFIRRAIRFGFSLPELSRFLTARENGKPPCHAVRATAGRILADLEQQIAELTRAHDSIQMTLIEWDRRLAEIGAGSPARLLESLTDDMLGLSTSRARGPSRARDHRPAGS